MGTTLYTVESFPLLVMYQRMTCAAARTAVLLYSTWWVGEWVGEWVRGFGWLTCFAVLFSGPIGAFTTRRWSAAYELDTYTSTALRYCCTAVAHGGWVDRLVDVSMGSSVGECVGWYVLDCVLS